MAEVVGIHWGSCCSSWTKLVRTPTSQDSCGKESSKKHWCNLVGKKSPDWECLFVHREHGFFLIGLRGWHQNGRQEAAFSSHVEETDERRWHWGANIISWSRLLGIHSKGMQTKREYYLTTEQDVWIPYFCWSNWEITRMGQTSCKNFSVGPATWKDMLENAWNDIANWQHKRTVGRLPHQKGRIGKIKVNCQKFSPILYLNACNWHELLDLTFCGQSTNWHDLSQNGLKHVTDDRHD